MGESRSLPMEVVYILSKAEGQYCVTRWKLLALVTFTKQYCSCLTGQGFLLCTDHSSLTWLCNFQDPEGQVAQWLERLQELDFVVVHRPGRKHTNADPLSCLPCRECGRESYHSPAPAPVVVATTTLQPPHDAHSGKVCDSQLVDSMLGPLLHAKETGKKKQC